MENQGGMGDRQRAAPWAAAAPQRVSGPVPGTARGPSLPGSQVPFWAEPASMDQE